MAMGPEDMAALKAQAGAKDQGSLVDLAQQVASGLQKLSQALDRAPGATPEEKDQMAGILSGFMDLVEKKLGAEAGGEGEEEDAEPADSALPMEGGASGVPMNMKMKQ